MDILPINFLITAEHLTNKPFAAVQGVRFRKDYKGLTFDRAAQIQSTGPFSGSFSRFRVAHADHLRLSLLGNKNIVCYSWNKMVGHFRPFNSHFRRSVAATTTISYKAAEERTNIPFGSGKADRNVCGPTVSPAVSSSTIFVSAGHENVPINIEMSEMPGVCRCNWRFDNSFCEKRLSPRTAVQ